MSREKIEAALGISQRTILDRAKVAEGEEWAKAQPEPSPDVLETQVWADGGSSWRSDADG